MTGCRIKKDREKRCGVFLLIAMLIMACVTQGVAAQARAEETKKLSARRDVVPPQPVMTQVIWPRDTITEFTPLRITVLLSGNSYRRPFPYHVVIKKLDGTFADTVLDVSAQVALDRSSDFYHYDYGLPVGDYLILIAPRGVGQGFYRLLHVTPKVGGAAVTASVSSFLKRRFVVYVSITQTQTLLPTSSYMTAPPPPPMDVRIATTGGNGGSVDIEVKKTDQVPLRIILSDYVVLPPSSANDDDGKINAVVFELTSTGHGQEYPVTLDPEQITSTGISFDFTMYPTKDGRTINSSGSNALTPNRWYGVRIDRPGMTCPTSARFYLLDDNSP